MTEAARGDYSIRIAPAVLATIVRISAEAVPGVVRLADARGLERLARAWTGDGVRVQMHEGAAQIDVHLVLDRSASMREVCTAVQRAVAEDVETMLGMRVAEVNVYVQSVG